MPTFVWRVKMNFVCLSRVLKTLNFSFLRTKCELKILRSKVPSHSRPFATNKFPIDNIRNLQKDVLVYTNEKTTFLKFLSFFGPAVLAVWVFYGGFIFSKLKDIATASTEPEDFSANRSSIWRKINLGDKKYRVFSLIMCLGGGVFTTIIFLAMPTRIVKDLILHKGGKIASIVTYGPFGKLLKQTAPLYNLSSRVSREQARSYIVVKIETKWFYYLVDSRGRFHQPALFDYTVGTKRVKAY